MKKKNNVYLMYAICFLQGFIFYGPIATIYRQSRGLSMYQIFLLESIFMVLMIVFEVPWGWVADRFGYKLTLVISNLMFLFSKIVFYEANTFYLFLLEAVLIALAISGLSGCDIALLYHSSDEGESEKVFGRYNAFGTMGFLVASIISTGIIARSIDLSAFLTIFPYLIAAFLTIFIKDVRVHLEDKPSLVKTFKSVMRNKEILLFVFAIALMNEVNHAVSVFLNQPQYQRSGINIKYFGLLMALVQIIRLGSAKSYRLTEKYGRKGSIKTLFVILTVCSFLLIYVDSAIWSVVLIACISGGFALVQPIALDIQNSSVLTNDRATVLSLYAMLGDIVASIVNLLIGRTADISLQSAFASCGAVSLISCGLVFIYFKYSTENIKVNTL